MLLHTIINNFYVSQGKILFVKVITGTDSNQCKNWSNLQNFITAKSRWQWYSNRLVWYWGVAQVNFGDDLRWKSETKSCYQHYCLTHQETYLLPMEWIEASLAQWDICTLKQDKPSAIFLKYALVFLNEWESEAVYSWREKMRI